MRGFTLGRIEDPARSRDPRIQAVVAGLGAIALPAPRPLFRDELRAQLVTVAATVVQESSEAVPATVHRHRRPFPVARTLRVVGALVVVVGLLLGAGVVASRNALPGDALYSLKRGWENVQLSFTHGTDRGKTYLQYSGRRAEEVSALVARSDASGTGVLAGATPSTHTVELIRSTLNTADSELADGARVLTEESNQQRSAGPLNLLIGWAPDQQSVLSSIQQRLPAGAARDRVTASLVKVQNSTTRAKLLAPLATCGCFERLQTDSYGPVPPGTSPTGSVPPGQPGSGGNGSAGNGSGGNGSGGNGSGGSRSPGLPTSGLPLPSLPVPSLPIPTRLPSLPIPTSLPSLPIPTRLPSLPIPTLSLPHLPGGLARD